MNSPLEPLVRNILGLPTKPKHIPEFECECQINQLGVKWNASIDFDCLHEGGSHEDEGFYVSVDTVRIQPADKPQAEWIEVDYGSLSIDSQDTIEAACIERFCS